MKWGSLHNKLINSKYHYFHTDNGVLLCGDCSKVLKCFSEESIDLVVTSPPYDHLRYYSTKNGKELESIWNFEKFKKVATRLYAVMKKGGVVIWVINDATIKGSETGNSFRQALYFKDKCGFNLHDTMIYAKKNPPPINSPRYNSSFEYMFVLTKGKIKTFNPIKEPCKYAGKVNKGTIRKSNGLTVNKTGHGRLCKDTKPKTNIWYYGVGYLATTKDKFAFEHPAMFPEQLAHDHIISWSNENDIILDPLCGSGTTLKMAEKLNRKWIGIEINKEYCEIAKKRILNQSKKS